MVTCKCGKVMERVPDWMQGVQVDFVCNNCPDRKTKNIAFIELMPEAPVAAKVETTEELPDMDDEE